MPNRPGGRRDGGRGASSRSGSPQGVGPAFPGSASGGGGAGGGRGPFKQGRRGGGSRPPPPNGRSHRPFPSSAQPHSPPHPGPAGPGEAPRLVRRRTARRSYWLEGGGARLAPPLLRVGCGAGEGDAALPRPWRAVGGEGAERGRAPPQPR